MAFYLENLYALPAFDPGVPPPLRPNPFAMIRDFESAISGNDLDVAMDIIRQEVARANYAGAGTLAQAADVARLQCQVSLSNHRNDKAAVELAAPTGTSGTVYVPISGHRHESSSWAIVTLGGVKVPWATSFTFGGVNYRAYVQVIISVTDIQQMMWKKI